MPDERETKGRNRWGTARERNRMRARHEIRMRVKSDAAAAAATDNHEEPHSCCDASSCLFVPTGSSSNHNVERLLSDDQVDILRTALRAIEAGKTSFFSLTVLSEHFSLFNQPFPVKLVSPYKIRTLCTSRFGVDQARMIQALLVDNGDDDARRRLQTCTLFEYAVWLGEYRLLGPMLAGGLDPTVRGRLRKSSLQDCTALDKECAAAQRQRRGIISARVLKRFFDVFPKCLSSYIVKRAIDMRFLHWQQKEFTSCDSSRDYCTLCGCSVDNGAQLLLAGWPCHDLFCENCFWESMLDNIDDRDDGDVVLCPVCGASGCQNNENRNAVVDDNDETPFERCQKSLQRFHALPETIEDLKLLPKRSKKNRQYVLASSWSIAVSTAVGSSQNVRKDKCFVCTESNAYRYVRGCLVAGMDVNTTNEYGQTCLFIAAWRGYTKLVKLLLDFGADPSVEDNGGANAETVSRCNGHTQILELLQQYSKGGSTISCSGDFLIVANSRGANIPELKTLIGTERDHPGAGSFLVDGGISLHCVDAMIQLWTRLPVEQPDARKNGKVCSVRSYYCDATGSICSLLTNAIWDAFKSYMPPLHGVLVFPYMRVLHYSQPGSILAPHQDLPRTDVSGQCSSHTFILYLADCEAGGETSLLGALCGPGRWETLARVSPTSGRLLLFPHACPHEGNEVVDVPKVLLRGEVKLTW